MHRGVFGRALPHRGLVWDRRERRTTPTPLHSDSSIYGERAGLCDLVVVGHYGRRVGTSGTSQGLVTPKTKRHCRHDECRGLETSKGGLCPCPSTAPAGVELGVGRPPCPTVLTESHHSSLFVWLAVLVSFASATPVLFNVKRKVKTILSEE